MCEMPSCVPSAPGLENAGAELGVDDVAEAMTWPNIIGLGEVMNFPGVVANDPVMAGEIAATVKAGKTVGGHYASRDLGLPFHGYVAGGAEDDHEGTRVEDAIARVRQGMKAMLQAGLGLVRRGDADQGGDGGAGSTRATSSCAPTTAIPARWSMKAIWTASCATPSRRG